MVALCLAANAKSAPPTASANIKREGDGKFIPLNVARLPVGTDADLFQGLISGSAFNVYVKEIPAQNLAIELGFVDPESKEALQNTFSVAANGTPLDANLDVWSKAGGSMKPWVEKFNYSHTGGALSVQFVGITKSAFVSYARITDSKGKVLGFGTAADWKTSNRIKLTDARCRPFRKVNAGEVAFYNADHSPVGSWASFVYGMEQSGGVMVCKGSGGKMTLAPDQGVILAVQTGTTRRLMPFAVNQSKSIETGLITESEVSRKLGACTDTWTIPLGVSWTHYTPVWQMKDWDKATLEEKRRFALPVTWMRYTIDNRSGKDETQLLFSLQQQSERSNGWDGFEGYLVDSSSAIAVKTGEAELITSEQAKKRFGVDGATSAFCIHVPAGTQKEVVFQVAQYKKGNAGQFEGHSLTMMSDAIFNGLEDILKTAQSLQAQAFARCGEADRMLENCGENPERRFLAAHALHSYQFNSILEAFEDKQPFWAIEEGECSFANTLDLTIDQIFYELAMHPWTVRNELDNFTKLYSYTDQIALPGQTETLPGGISFYHDMGNNLGLASREKGAAYGTPMTQEELQNWIICAALYWKVTGDNAWLQANEAVIHQAFDSMLRRDDPDPAKRDGITTYASIVKGRNRPECTTYDAMDPSLNAPQNSLYISMKSFACYLMLKPVFNQLGEPDLAKQSAEAAAYTAKGIDSHWNPSLNYFPGLFDGKSKTAVIPAVESLVYPYAMGLGNELSSDGPYGVLMNHLKTHMQTILVPGVCIDAKTGGWNLSSSAGSTWMSKVFLSQFVTEKILGLKNNATGHDADLAHFAYEVLGSPVVCFTDQITTSADHKAYGCRHYPRGVTSALWWLWPDHH